MGFREAAGSYKDRSLVLRALGVLLMLAGAGLLLLGPLELRCYPDFEAGGRFHYEGFGFGSLMYGIITLQVVGYPLLAAALIPLGYGHLMLREWALKLSLAYLWAWIAIGAPVVVFSFFILAGTKDMPVFGTIASILLLVLAYPVLPALLIKFYHGRNAVGTLKSQGPRECRIGQTPTGVLAASLLMVFFAAALYAMMLFNCLFPVFGTFLTGRAGLAASDFLAALFLAFAWGLLGMRRWAWWASTVTLGLFIASTIATYCLHSFPAILAALAFPAYETNLLRGIPLQGFHFALLAGLPLLAGMAALLTSKKHFK